MFEPAGEDERPERQPPPADDRLWRHPSEVARAAAGGAAASRSSDPRLSGRRFSMGTVVVAGSLGALAMLATLTTFGMIASTASSSDDDDNAATGPQERTSESSAALTALRAAPGVLPVRLGGDATGVTGAALVLTSPGAVVTTLHVDPDSPVAIETTPGTWTTAVLDGTDPATGISLLRVRGATGSAARATAAPRVGQTVAMLAVGPSQSSADDHVNTVIRTNGPLRTDDVSRVGLTTITSPRPCGPSDVAVDHDGAVIALVADIDDDDDDHISYAVPAEVALRVGSQLAEHGAVVHGRIDAGISLVGDVLTVTEIAPGSRAAEADLRDGDEVTSIDSTPVNTAPEIEGALVGRNAGEWVHVGVRRDHRMLTRTVQLTGPATAMLVSTTTLG